MRFSLITSVLALCLTVSAIPVNLSQPDQSFVSCKSKLEVAENSVSHLEQKVTGKYRDYYIREATTMKPGVEKDLKNALDECKKVTHLSSEEATAFQDAMLVIFKKTENIVATASLRKNKDILPSADAIKDINTLYKHFQGVSSGFDKAEFEKLLSDISFFHFVASRGE